ncbi:hypothetical protein [Antrihabitans cavernicola]|uniref:hypothetical protein n=1 Tax=Antrihabitans cavernicola TaxID=2495913 RepID=UPI001BE3EEC5|nr:hypothetical protein [Spelaeibacter cavernicola]
MPTDHGTSVNPGGAHVGSQPELKLKYDDQCHSRGHREEQRGRMCPNPEALYRYLTTRLAEHPIASIETAPVLRTQKAVAPIRPV